MKKEYNLYTEASGKTKLLIKNPAGFKYWCINKWGDSFYENADLMREFDKHYGKEQLVVTGIIDG